MARSAAWTFFAGLLFLTIEQSRGAQDADQPPVVVTSTLPRLRLAWTAANLQTMPGTYEETFPVLDGALMASGVTGGVDELVAVELATGKERWRVPYQGRGDMRRIEPAKGMALVNREDGQTFAFDVRTGKQLWTAKLGLFMQHLRDNGTVGFALCQGPSHRTREPTGTVVHWHTSDLVAFDLATGRKLWQGTKWMGPNVVIGAQSVFAERDGKLRALEPRTGREAPQVALAPPAPIRSWSVVAAEPGGRPALLVNGGGDEGRTNRLVALELPSGRELWSRPYPQPSHPEVRGATVHEGRLFEIASRAITELDVATGQVVRACSLPRVDPGNAPPRLRLMNGEVVAALGAPYRQPAVVVRCSAGAGPPAVAQLPRPPVGPGALVAIDDGIIVLRANEQLWAYRVFETDPPETALRPAQRVEMILDRTDNIDSAARELDELRAVPNMGRHLLALARDPESPRHDHAVDAATALRVPGVVDLLLGEIFRAPPAPPLATEAQARVHAHPSPVAVAYRDSLWRRADLIVMLAAMDDATAATRLGPLLAARSTREALGWWDWNLWGRWSPEMYGLQAWDGESRRERRMRLQGTNEKRHSETLSDAVGRSEAHAAVYRLLARLGRGEDAARLDELHRTTTRAGGWAAICAADDAIAEPGPERLWVEPWGLCRGIDLGDYRVTQARSFIWLRRRLADGSFGPPAWAYDVGGDRCLKQRIMQTAELRGGHVVVRGTPGEVILANVQPALLFADADGDGLTDATEVAFGTDPKRADTDGDGVPDGRDPAPLATPPPDAGGDAAGEVLRFAELFLVGGPLTLQGERAGWVESASAAGVTLHLPADASVDDQVCESARGHKPGLRTPFPLARVQSLKVDGDRAQARFAWSERDTRHAHDLTLARVRGQWRVIGDRVTGLSD